jgi:hypothetical protein
LTPTGDWANLPGDADLAPGINAIGRTQENQAGSG